MERLSLQKTVRVLLPISLLALATTVGWVSAESQENIPRVIAEGQNIDLIAVCITEGELDDLSREVIGTRNPYTGFTAFARWKGNTEDIKQYQATTIDRMLAFEPDAGLRVDSTLGIVNHVAIGGPTPSDNLHATVICPTRIPRVLGQIFRGSAS